MRAAGDDAASSSSPPPAADAIAAENPPPLVFTFVDDSDAPAAVIADDDDDDDDGPTGPKTTAGGKAATPARSSSGTTTIKIPSRATLDECHPMAMMAKFGGRRTSVNKRSGSPPSPAAAAAAAAAAAGGGGGENFCFDDGSSADPEHDIYNINNEESSGGMKNANDDIPRVKEGLDEESGGSEREIDGEETRTSTRQRAAMDRFLAAQLNGNAIAREAAWGELVRTMKRDQQQQQHYAIRSSSSGVGGHRHHRGGSRGGGRRGGASATGRDDVLGMIRIGGGLRIGAASDVVSIHSGLTSSECETAAAAGAGAVEEGSGGCVVVAHVVGGGGGGRAHARTSTPTDCFPVGGIMGKGDDLPLVSPLSLDGSFGRAVVVDDEHRHRVNVTMESTIATEEEEDDDDDRYSHLYPPVLVGRTRSDGNYYVAEGEGKGKEEEEEEEEEMMMKKMKKKSPVFFDIGKPFSDNAKFSPLAESSEGTTPSGARERIGGPVLPSALSSPTSFVSSAGRSSHGGSNGSGAEGASYGEGGGTTRHAAREAASSRQPPNWHGRVRNAHVTNTSFVAHSNDGEVVTFDEMDEQTRGEDEVAVAAATARFPFYPRSMPPEKELENTGSSSSSSPPQRSYKRRVKRRGGGGGNKNNLSLEEQILNVLQQQSESYVVEDEGGGEKEQEALFGHGSPIPTSSIKSKEKSGRVVKSGTLGSVASAQDILRELRSSTQNAPPLGSISIGGRGQEQVHHLEDQSTKIGDDSCPTAHVSALALAPSRRDVPRPYQLNRRSASEPNQAAPAAMSVCTTNPGIDVSTTTKLKDESFKPQDAYSSTKFRNSSISERAVLETAHADCSQADESPLERYRKAVGMSQEDSAPVKFSRIRGIFPKTSPASTITTMKVRAQPPALQFKSSNPFDSPPRCMLTKKIDNPFEEQSSPIPCTQDDAAVSHDVNISVEPYNLDEPASEHSSYTSGMCISYMSEKAIAPPTNDDLPTSSPNSSSRPPMVLVLAPSKRDTLLARASSSPFQVPMSSNHSSRPQNDLDEIRASIFQLKNNGVGGLGKSTSTLVRNEDTGRYVIRDVDGDIFHDDINIEDVDFPKVIDKGDQESNNVEHAGVVGTSLSDRSCTERPRQQLNDMNDSHNLFHDSREITSIQFMMKDQVMSESVLDDDAVEDAVWAATEGLSTASTLSEGEKVQLHVKVEENGEEFFVIRKPQHQEWGTNWTSFAAADDDDYFDICPSESNDEWGGSDQWDCTEDYCVREGKVNDVSYFVSPTSVAANGRVLK